MKNLNISLIKSHAIYRGMFETQKSGKKTGAGEIDFNIGTHVSPKKGDLAIR